MGGIPEIIQRKNSVIFQGSGPKVKCSKFQVQGPLFQVRSLLTCFAPSTKHQAPST
jgi:hypothetical protein